MLIWRKLRKFKKSSHPDRMSSLSSVRSGTGARAEVTDVNVSGVLWTVTENLKAD